MEDIRNTGGYLLFEEVPLLQSECVCLGNDGDDVDHLAETPHELHVERPQTEELKRKRSDAVMPQIQQGADTTAPVILNTILNMCEQLLLRVKGIMDQFPHTLIAPFSFICGARLTT